MSLFQSIWSLRTIEFYKKDMWGFNHIIITYGIYDNESKIFIHVSNESIDFFTMTPATDEYEHGCLYSINYSRPDDVVIYDGPVLSTDTSTERFFLEYCRKKIYKFHGFEDIAILAH